jgi:hypothetical protein
MPKETIGTYPGAIELVHLGAGMAVPLETEAPGVIIVADETGDEAAYRIDRRATETLELSFLHLALVELGVPDVQHTPAGGTAK